MSNFVLRFVVNLQPHQLCGSSGCSTSSPTHDYIFSDGCIMVFIMVLLYIRLLLKELNTSHVVGYLYILFWKCLVESYGFYFIVCLWFIDLWEWFPHSECKYIFSLLLVHLSGLSPWSHVAVKSPPVFFSLSATSFKIMRYLKKN